eukprot:TRINITY_DN67775_c15_g1_i11.p1 TRINITY_DN67775_c15_g1~~TRINITY_DN67775_c15_g1_i11.p1  ORF type:complete len:298 (+),score=-2.10 TRINITY_DN67775_c15_g1_i11:256-1149(+)
MTPSEGVTIYLYTCEHLNTLNGQPFYSHLNHCLHTRTDLESYAPYIFLFLSALRRLPVVRGRLWRRVGTNEDQQDIIQRYSVEIGGMPQALEPITWHAFSSCSTRLQALSNLGQPTGRHVIVFEVNATGYDVASISQYPESEAVIVPLSQFEVKGMYSPTLDCNMVQLQQIPALNDVFSVFPQRLGTQHVTRPRLRDQASSSCGYSEDKATQTTIEQPEPAAGSANKGKQPLRVWPQGHSMLHPDVQGDVTVRPSVRPSVRLSVRPLVCPSIRPSVRPSIYPPLSVCPLSLNQFLQN